MIVLVMELFSRDCPGTSVVLEEQTDWKHLPKGGWRIYNYIYVCIYIYIYLSLSLSIYIYQRLRGINWCVRPPSVKLVSVSFRVRVMRSGRGEAVWACGWVGVFVNTGGGGGGGGGGGDRVFPVQQLHDLLALIWRLKNIVRVSEKLHERLDVAPACNRWEENLSR